MHTKATAMNNTITQPPLPDTIHFHHTINNDKTEVMRITREGVWVNPDMSADETAKAVLDALDSYIKVLVKNAVEAEREACAKVCEEKKSKYEERSSKPEDARDIDSEVARIAKMTCDFNAAAIRARGER